jgi:hypothetical protein
MVLLYPNAIKMQKRKPSLSSQSNKRDANLTLYNFTPHLSHPRPPKRMRLGIKHPLIQTNHIVPTKRQIKIFERLCRPKALHLIFRIIVSRQHGRVPNTGHSASSRDIRRRCECHVADLAVAKLGARRGYNGSKHVPCVIEIGAVGGT